VVLAMAGGAYLLAIPAFRGLMRPMQSAPVPG